MLKSLRPYTANIPPGRDGRGCSRGEGVWLFAIWFWYLAVYGQSDAGHALSLSELFIRPQALLVSLIITIMTTLYGGGTGVLPTLLSTNTLSLYPLDILILGLFLVATLFVGLSYGRQVKTLKDYALGGKCFSTNTLVATIVATVASGSFLFICLENTYTDGLYHIIAGMGLPLNLWLIGQLVAIRMEEFMQHMSVAEAMGSMYGRTVQIITACSSALGKVGFIAIQFKVTKIIEVLFKVEGTAATLISAGIVVLYSASGGIKAVTFTDVLQFITFGIVIPILAVTVWNSAHTSSHITTLANNTNFDLRQVESWDKKLFSSIGLLLYFAIPGISPAAFQRIAMAKSTRQARRAFTYAAGILLLIFLVLVWVGTLILIDRPGLAKDQVVPYMISQYTYVGLRGLLGAGVMALAVYRRLCSEFPVRHLC